MQMASFRKVRRPFALNSCRSGSAIRRLKILAVTLSVSAVEWRKTCLPSFFSAVSGGVSGFGIHLLSALALETKKHLEDSLDVSVSESKASTHFWKDPVISKAAIFVTADFIQGPEGKSRQRAQVHDFAYVFRALPGIDRYYLQDRYMTPPEVRSGCPNGYFGFREAGDPGPPPPSKGRDQAAAGKAPLGSSIPNNQTNPDCLHESRTGVLYTHSMSKRLQVLILDAEMEEAS